ncbi:uncharacterized protein BDW70DRAFT_121235 [Aspergillus foveolatus]|uniref:uncharacterized protein n=1 Tax=Aspergillus foveolatus TaxID=210207 RepID=UPI003CCCCF23
MALRMPGINHAAGIFADMSVDGPAIGTLVAVVDRAKNLPNRKTMGKQNPYCAARLGKEAQKTGTDVRGGQTPKWDQELRFTVHESPDYFRMKLSVFNDDKRTDLIGETWIDLQNLIIPGGSQSDQWHTLQFRGKYAGEIRLEMTYYDTRPEDEAVIERRTQGTERAKTSGSSRSGPAAVVPSPAPSSSSSSSLSGPRQLKEVKRRPLPSDHSSGPRPAPEKAYSSPAPLPVSHPPRAPYDGVPTPPSSSGMDYAYQPRHTAAPVVYDAPPRPRTYETPDDFGREWNAPPHHPPAGRSQPHYPEYYPTRAEQDYYARPRSGYENVPPADYRSMRQPPAGRQDPYYEDMHAEATRPSSRHYNQHPPDAYTYGPEEPQPVRYHHASSSMSSRHRIEYPQESEPYRQHNSLPRRGRSPGRYHAEYASMQPRVEDEDEEGAPPPPPVHRTAMAHPSPQLVPSPAPSYKAYSPEYGPRSTQDMNLPQPTELMLDPPPVTNTSSMPPSLVAGLDPVVAEAESERVAREFRRRSGVLEEHLPGPNRSRDPSPSPISPPYPNNPPAEDHHRSLVSRRSVNAEAPSQQLVLRKSVSPRPPPSRGRGGSQPSVSQTPFSPDSFDSFNPNAARSVVNRDPAPAYTTPAEAMEAARRSEAAAARPEGPIIGDDGREIDPSDHLPTDTWAPEPDRKPRKPGVIVRFRNAPTRHSPAAPRPTSSYVPTSDGDRGRPGYGSNSGHGRTYSTPSSNPMPRRHSISPSPSPMYAPAPVGPPIPAKVPIGAPTGVQDALSRELNSIDIGSVGFSSSRAMRKYVPRPTGYAV